ncbi:heavy-metal-associated domain-containing protein [Aquimarina sp. 2201CG1-2-11]|uniref:cation transporter n=1 Tax=Aquimarina discodermiae TaxID=3231043 RepID=UPI00346353C4
MNKTTIITILLVIISCNRIEKEERVLRQDPGDEIFVIHVPKAGCKKCQKIIEEGLQNENGVQQSILDLSSKKLSVVYTPEKVTPKILETTVKKIAKKIPCK